jgi:phage-related protein
MAGIPKVKISFDADYADLKRGVKGAQDEVGGFGDKVKEFGKKAAAAFAVAAAAAAAYATKLAVDGVKAAIEDAAAQERLRASLENVLGANDDVVASVEDFIAKTEVAVGVADDKLRPAYSRLAVATKDVDKANQALTLALDISAATGKNLETVSDALGKAYEGNTGALSRLGLGISTAEIKALGLDGTMNRLSETFGGTALKQANTLEGQIQRLKVGFDNAKEVIGYALLPIVEKMADFFANTVLPIITKFSNQFGREDGESLLSRLMSVVDFVRDFFQPIWDAVIKAFGRVKDAIMVNKDNFSGLIDTLRDVFDWVNKYIIPIFKTQLVGAIEVASTAISLAIKAIVPIVKFVTDSVKTLINFVIDGINLLIKGYNGLARLLGKPTIALLSKIGETRSQEDYNAIAGVPAAFTGTTTTTTTAASAAAGAAAGAAVSAAAGSAAKSTAKAVEKAAPTLIEEVIAANAAKLIPPGVFDPAAFRLGEARADAGLLVNGGAIPSTFDVAAARRGEMEQAPITINVNAPSIIDEEGFNRALQLAVNNSYYRGTGGGTALIT